MHPYPFLSDTWKRLTLVGCLLLITSCAQLPAEDASDQPFAERIVVTADNAELTAAQLLARMQDADVIYLGERHDNARHHAIQGSVISELVAAGRQPVLGFEFFSREQSGHLLQYVARKEADETDEKRLRERLGWGPRRDASWPFYFELLEIARSNGLPAFGLDLPRAMRARLQRQGLEGLTAFERSMLPATGFADDAYRAKMFEQLKAAHCGYGNEEYLGRLYDTWIARNDAMASSLAALLDEYPGRPLVVILGGGHVVENLGVFERLAHLRPSASQLNLGLVEHREDRAEDAPLAYQYVWFTAPQERGDPCEAFRRRHKK